MISSKQFLILALWLCTALPAFAQTGSTADEREDNRRKLERLKDQPEELARIRKKALFFLSLPEDQRARLVELDQKLQKEPMSSRKRLERAMGRYAAWLENLDPDQRRLITDAKDTKTRLEIIKKIRAEQWLKTQPSGVQQELAKLHDGKRAEKIRGLQNQERKKKNLWIISSRFWDELSKGRSMPARLSDFDGEVTSFFNEYLSPRLSPKEKALLKEAEGSWPQFPMTLVAVADRHPLALPAEKMFRRWDELPAEVKKRIPTKKGNLSKTIKLADGTPKFPHVISELARRRKVSLPHDLWPYGYEALSPPMRKFVKDKLTPLLAADEKLAMTQATSWPDYPVTLQKFAENHDLEIPWHTLPGNPEIWDKYRLKQRLIK